MVEVRSIPLGGVDYSGQPLPAQGQYVVPDASGGWAPYAEPNQPTPQTAAPAAGGWAPYVEQQPKAPAEPVSTAGAAGLGALKGATFGAYPMLAGAAQASGIELPKPQEQTQPEPVAAETGGDPLGALQYAATGIARPIVGAYRAVTGQPDAVETYNRAREDALKQLEQAQAQHPLAFMAGEVGGGLAATPALGPLGSLRAASVPGRVLQSAKVGGITGGLFGAGEAGSRGEAPVEVAKQAGLGAAVGAPLGGVLGGAVETGAGVARGVGSIIRGRRDPELEAARQVADVMRRGAPATAELAADRPAIQAGIEAGTPVFNVDVAGQPARRLLRTATNLSPEAQEVASRPVVRRFHGQTERVGDWVLNRFGGGDVGRTLDDIKRAAQQANAPNYKRAEVFAERRYPRGIGPDQSTEIERLLSAKVVRQAIAGAIEQGSTRDVAQGMGGFNRSAVVDPNTGMLTFTGARGPKAAFPDLRLWDYTQRILGDMGKSLQRSGQDSQAAAIFQIKSDLLRELDRLVPPFQNARGVAARFFNATDALEAGEQFVRASNVGGRKLRDPEVERMIASMPAAEQALFRYGFATELANSVRGVGDNQTVVNKLANSPNARRRIEVALGPGGADELEALLRIEGLVDRARTAAFGNSTTAQQLGDAGSFGAAAGVSSEAARSLNPLYLVTGALLYAGRQARHAIDNEVATHIARMLVSEDPTVFARGVQIAAKNPVVRDALRRASDLSLRELMSTIGPGGTAAGALTLGRQVLPGGIPKSEPKAQTPDYYEQDQQHRP